MKSRKNLYRKGRMNQAKKWLLLHHPDNLVQAYIRRYKVSEARAIDDLIFLGYQDEIQIQSYEQEGVEWEYRYDGYADRMKVVPVGTEDWELHNF